MRKVLTIVSAVAAFFFISLFTSLFTGEWLSVTARLIVSVVAAAAAAWFTWARFDSYRGSLASLVSAMLISGAVVGGIGFALGFFGPILLTPEANQGPLLGIFITGPLGFVLGAAWGGYRWSKRRGQPPPLP